MRRAAAVDANQPDIVDALRKVGASVAITSGVAAGFPDLTVGFRQRTYLLEVKDGDKFPSKRRLTPDQQEWHASWRGHVCVVETIDQALAAIGVCPTRHAEGSVNSITAKPRHTPTRRT